MTQFNVLPTKSNFDNSYLEKFTNYFRTVKGDNHKNEYVETKYQSELLQSMLQTVAVGDFCLIGNSGCGKTMLVNKIAEILGREIENIVLYQDMTSRDLLQQRTTLQNGDTVWRFAPLVEAAIEGKIAILDGINRIHPSTLSVLHRLVNVY